MPLFAELIPTLHVLPFILRDVFRTGVQRPVRRGEREVEEIGTSAAAELVNLTDSMIGEGIGHVEAFALFVWLIVQCQHTSGFRMEVIGRAADQAEVALETAVGGPVRAVFSDMPLPGHSGAIAALANGLGNGDAMVVQIALIGERAAVVHHVPDAGLMAIESGQQSGAGGAAACCVVEACQAQAARRQFVQIRSRYLRSEGPDIGESHIVGHHQNDVGTLAGC